MIAQAKRTSASHTPANRAHLGHRACSRQPNVPAYVPTGTIGSFRQHMRGIRRVQARGSSIYKGELLSGIVCNMRPRAVALARPCVILLTEKTSAACRKGTGRPSEVWSPVPGT